MNIKINSEDRKIIARKKYGLNSFFAGIGGFDVAFEKHGFSTKLLCEINPFCNQILSRHWPNVLKATDINTIDVNVFIRCIN